MRLSPRGQDTLFNAIRTGGCRNYNDRRTPATAPVNVEAQLLLMPDAPPPTKADRDLANAFEARVERIAALCPATSTLIVAGQLIEHRAQPAVGLRGLRR